ncbi:type ISP restriction/modification enzyme [Pelagerythrobacter aerophilus]|uniref:type ISP restriction/modification enzyme n=1 Tax=Pelagerythrobacter aerophilus TaxID=2306995 RepID=UPI001E3C5406|nr:type ISP restriction/modification enzyme [Pelagerythrobacter aerophilus]
MSKSGLAELVSAYVTATRKLAATSGSNEATYYPDIRNLLAAILKAGRLPFDVRVNTSESRGRGVDMPDFVLGDGGFVGVYGEVKLPDASLEDMAASTAQNDQIGRYLSATGVVLLCNIRGFGLLTVKPGATRERGVPVGPENRELIKTVDLWSAMRGSGKHLADEEIVAEFAAIVDRAVTDFAPLADPADLAKVLARQARDAKDAMPGDLRPISVLLDDFALALGLSFDLDDEKGDRFFRGSLIQTAFYSLFAAWILWDRDASKPDNPFTINDAEGYLRIPFLQELFHDLRSPRYLRQLDLAVHLERAVATLNRVDLSLFKQRMSFPTASGHSPTVAAITYFYEPFLEAFDPELREELGVWYTPPEIVHYQVRRVHHLLKTELGIARGLAANEVVVLDPCCGTGAYLLEVARCINDELVLEGADDTLALELLDALTKRVIGFEILTAPFAVAQLQLFILLADLGAAPAPDQRLSIFLTNALTGWSDERDVKITFPEMKDEFDASQSVKRDAKIIVVLGNPPYDRFAGVAQAEEAELVAAYKGVRLQIQREKDGTIKRDRMGNPEKKQIGNSELYDVWGVRKQLLDDLYIRFFRMAEERIGVSAERGVVSFISNSSWLTGRSHPMMRQSLLRNFDELWIDNLNGDKFKTGKVIPRGLPGEGTRDDSAFTTEMDPRGIQPGTAIATFLKKSGESAGQTATVHFREYWGPAANKRLALNASLPDGTPPAGADNPAYEAIAPSMENRWRLAVLELEGGYESWPALDELFPEMIQGVNANRGVEGTVIDYDAAALSTRMQSYLNADTFESAAALVPAMAKKFAGYDAKKAWDELHPAGFAEGKIEPILMFPFDQRFIYYETEHKLLNRPRGEFAKLLADNEFLITVPEPRKASETRPLFAQTLVNLHVHERGSVVIPRDVEGHGLFAGRLANIAEPAWTAFRDAFGLSGRREDEDAKDFVGQLQRVILALLHAPAYQSDHKSALSADWAHPPVPRDKELFDKLAAAGTKVTTLLDASVPAGALMRELLGEQMGTLGTLRRSDGAQVRPQDLKITVGYWGGSKGRWLPREPHSEEVTLDILGERTGDLYLNDDCYFANVPAAVWQYQLGGYPVLKKWLGYRQADRRKDSPLTLAEAKWLRSVIQRIAALVAIGADLDSLYAKASEIAFTAEELGLRK